MTANANLKTYTLVDFTPKGEEHDVLLHADVDEHAVWIASEFEQPTNYLIKNSGKITAVEAYGEERAHGGDGRWEIVISVEGKDPLTFYC